MALDETYERMLMHTITKEAGKLEIGDNLFRDGHIYMVTDVTFNDDDTTVTLKVGYARKVDDGFEKQSEFTFNVMRPVTVYVK